MVLADVREACGEHGRRLTDPPHECGGAGASGETPAADLAGGLGGWPCEVSIRWLGGCHLMLTQVYTGGPDREQGSRKLPGILRNVPRCTDSP